MAPGSVMTSRLSACGGSGYPTNQQLLVDPDNNDNPTTGTETAGAYLYKWDHDNSGDEWHAPMNLPFALDWNAAEVLPALSINPYSTGQRCTCNYYPISPTWAQEVIDWLSLTQSGTYGSYDSYPMVLGNISEFKIRCGGVDYAYDTLIDARILLWTADNDLHAAITLDMSSTNDDSAIESKLALANPSKWSDDNFYVSIKLKEA